MKNFIWVAVAALCLESGLSVSAESLKGKISIDGSSTVYPITEAVAEEARSNADLKKVRVGVNISGTGGGFKKFCKGETDVSDASRPIKASEMETCKKNGVDYVELPIAFDGIAVVVNKSNTCIDEISVADLKRIWEPAAEGKITNWKQVSAKCPDMPLKLYGPGLDSGTFDYFTEVINGKGGSSRPDFTKSEDDNILVTGIEGDKGSLGYFGFAYYVENQAKLKVLKIKDGSAAAIEPTKQTIANASYRPLSRPIFIYVSKKSAEKPEVAAFVNFYIENASRLADAVGYVSLAHTPKEVTRIYSMIKDRFTKRTLGTVFGKEDSHKKPVSQLLESGS